MLEQRLIDALNYMVIKMAVKFVYLKDGINRDIENALNLFNERTDNNFTKNKVSLFPFLLSVANGKKKELIEFFNFRFVPNQLGIVHYDLNIALNFTPQQRIDSGLNFLFSFEDGFIKIDVPGAITFLAATDDAAAIIAMAEEDKTYVDNSIELRYINKSIEFMHSERIEDFAILSEQEFSFHSKNNSAYKNHDFINPDMVGFIITLTNEKNEFEPYSVPI